MSSYLTPIRHGLVKVELVKAKRSHTATKTAISCAQKPTGVVAGQPGFHEDLTLAGGRYIEGNATECKCAGYWVLISAADGRIIGHGDVDTGRDIGYRMNIRISYVDLCFE